jgi:hypothetical protein
LFYAHNYGITTLYTCITMYFYLRPAFVLYRVPLNRKPLFAGPLPPLLGGCERQDEYIPLGGGPRDGVNIAARMGGLPVAVR